MAACQQFLSGRVLLSPQICHLYGQEDRGSRLRSPRRPGGGQAQNGDDGLCLLDGSGDEAGLRWRLDSYLQAISILKELLFVRDVWEDERFDCVKTK